jgi:hypothetical protein
LSEFTGDLRISILGDQHAIALVRQGQNERIRGTVLFGEIERVNDLMPALPEPDREPARQLSIDQTLHTARGRMR